MNTSRRLFSATVAMAIAATQGVIAYNLVAGAPRGKHVLTFVANDPGLQAYAFTFGP